jgi:hypothetical protein
MQEKNMAKSLWTLLMSVFLASFSTHYLPVGSELAWGAEKGKGAKKEKTTSKKKKKKSKGSAKNRKGKIISAVGGVEFLNGVAGVSGMGGLFASRNFILEAGGYFGGFSGGKKYFEMRGQLKYFVGNWFYLGAGAGYGSMTVVHNELIFKSETEEFNSWTEGLSFARLYGSGGAQWQGKMFTAGAELSAGYNMKIGGVKDDIPISEQTGEPVAIRERVLDKSPATIGIGVALYAGLAF